MITFDNRLDVPREAVVFGGNSEGSAMLDPFKSALCESENAIFDSVVDESPNVADIIAEPDKFKKMIEGKALVLRSLSCLAVSDDFVEWRENAQGIFLIAPVEPIGVPKTFYRAAKVVFDPENKKTAEDPSFVPGPLQGPRELRRHKKINAKNPFVAARFSTMRAILGAPAGSFPGGLGYFEYKGDQFKYPAVYGNAVSTLIKHSYDAATFEDNHMGAAYRPESTTAQLKAYLEARN